MRVREKPRAIFLEIQVGELWLLCPEYDKYIIYSILYQRFLPFRDANCGMFAGYVIQPIDVVQGATPFGSTKTHS